MLHDVDGTLLLLVLMLGLLVKESDRVCTYVCAWAHTHTIVHFLQVLLSQYLFCPFPASGLAFHHLMIFVPAQKNTQCATIHNTRNVVIIIVLLWLYNSDISTIVM